MLRRTFLAAIAIIPMAGCIAEDAQQLTMPLLDAALVDTWVSVFPNVAETQLDLQEDGTAYYTDATHEIMIRWEIKGGKLQLSSDVLDNPDVDKVGSQYISHLKKDGTLILRHEKTNATYIFLRKHVYIQSVGQ